MARGIRLTARYSVDYVRQLGGTARIIRGDRGTENENIAASQRFSCRDADDSFATETVSYMEDQLQIRE